MHAFLMYVKELTPIVDPSNTFVLGYHGVNKQYPLLKDGSRKFHISDQVVFK